jgi:hypothetical protein
MVGHTKDREQIFSDIICFLQAVRVSSLDCVFLLVDQSLHVSVHPSWFGREETHSADLFSDSSTL